MNKHFSDYFYLNGIPPLISTKRALLHLPTFWEWFDSYLAKNHTKKINCLASFLFDILINPILAQELRLYKTPEFDMALAPVVFYNRTKFTKFIKAYARKDIRFTTFQNCNGLLLRSASPTFY